MSTKISKKKFIEMERTLIRQEIDEASTSANVPGYMTPNAFSGKGKMDRRDSVASGSGYDKVDEGKFAVTFDLGPKLGGLAKIIVDAQGASQAKTMVAKNLRKGMKAVKGVKRIQGALGKQIDKKTEQVTEGKSNYHTWKEDKSLTPKQKIGRAIREVRSSLSDLSKVVDRSVKLKNEMEVNSSDYWKTTHKALSKISERLVKMANKVGKLQ